jgi:polysaccharide deacetylase 2 family uncharacterized protein YibQ
MAKRAKKKSSARRGKKRTKKGTSKKSFPGWIVGVAILTLTLLIFALWIGKGSRHGDIPVPPYEEKSKNGFTELVDEVEVAIYQSLRQLGVQQSQVQFRKVTHRTQQDKQWDFAELDVSLTQSQNFTQIEEIFTRNLTALGSKVSWETRKKTSTHLELLVHVEDILTHRLALFLRGKLHRAKSPPESPAKLAIVIDDFGYDGRLARRFLEIEGQLSFSVLPHGTFSGSIARRVHEAGRELLLHLPMEPKAYPKVNPGVGALLMKMTDAELVQTLRQNLDSLPYISGENNHTGSRLSEQEEKMRLVMQELKNRNLFFIDSRTSRKTKAYSVAQQLEIPSAERDVFLDNIQSPRAIRSQMNRLIQRARLKGTAIGIAHPHEATLSVLKEVIPNLSGKGVELVPVSKIVHDENAAARISTYNK